MLVMADRLHYTIERDADLMYHSCDDFIADLKVVQQSLATAGAKRSAYGPLQDLIWQAQTFGFHMVEMEFRQHSVVHARPCGHPRTWSARRTRRSAADDPRRCSTPSRALRAIQKRNGLKAARRYIISFTKSAQNIKDVYEAQPLGVLPPGGCTGNRRHPLFEQLEDLQNSVDVLEEMIKIPGAARLKATPATSSSHARLLRFSKDADAGPTSATLALHSAGSCASPSGPNRTTSI